MENKIQTKTYAIDKPMQMAKMATILKQHILKNNLSVQIVGKDYVLVEGWQFAGGLMGLHPRIVEVKEIGSMRWMAQAEIVNSKTKEVVGSGYALCSKAESKKASFDEYAILSMAQTRAIGKAFRNLIGWVIKMSGYEGTPAEEMNSKIAIVNVKEATNQPKTDDNLGGLMASQVDKDRITKVAKEMGLKTVGQLEKKVGLKVDFMSMTKTQASRIYAELLNKQVK